MEGKARLREKLDVPSVAPLEQKLANLTRERPAIGPAPRSAVLDKIASFLPQLAHENEQLEKQMQVRPATDFDIEHVEEGGEEAYIEMDLACGILDLHDQAALLAAERAMNGQGALCSADESSSDDGDSSDESDNEDGSDDEASKPTVSRGGGDEGRASSGGSQGKLNGAGGLPRAVTSMDADAATTSSLAEDTMNCENAGGGAQLVEVRKGAGGIRARGSAPAVAPRGDAAVAEGRRKVAAKRSKMIQELP